MTLRGFYALLRVTREASPRVLYPGTEASPSKGHRLVWACTEAGHKDGNWFQERLILLNITTLETRLWFQIEG